MKKYYTYSVKELLEEYFPGDTFPEMSKAEDECDFNDKRRTLAIAWAYADRMARRCFDGVYFLKEAILCEDYIAYIVYKREKTIAMLCFMHFEDAVPFDLDAEYASRLCEQWRRKGYEVLIMRNCVGFEERRNGAYRCVFHGCKNMGIDYLKPVLLYGQYVFVSEYHQYFNHATALLYHAIVSRSRQEYEMALTEEARIAECKVRCGYENSDHKYDNATAIVEGIDGIKACFEDGPAPFLAYMREDGSCEYKLQLVMGDYYYILFVNRRNRLCQLIKEEIPKKAEIMMLPDEMMPEIVKMPELVSIRTLDVKEMHSFALSLMYADGCVKNYYLYTFDTLEIPERFSVDGYEFDMEGFNSARYIKDPGREGVVFSNGYFIPLHILYYNGKSQLIPEKLEHVIIRHVNIEAKGIYRIPPEESRQLFTTTYMPRADEYYGVNEALIDFDGNRVSNYSGSYMESNRRGKQVFATYSEANGKAGYLKKDGTWLIPPIFDKAEDFCESRCMLAEKDGKQFLINIYGEIIPFDYSIDTDCFCDGLCPFSAGKYEGSIEYPEERYFDHLIAGVWGYIDKYGEVVIEPKYVFASGFDFYDNRAFVAKEVDGQILWGLIDATGKEIIPCIYPNLATHSGTAVNFQVERGGMYGIMDFDGNVIMEPRYRVIESYDEKHGLIAAGECRDRLGVVRLKDGKVIVPFDKDYVSFEEDYIDCESIYSGDTMYDYNGGEITNKERTTSYYSFECDFDKEALFEDTCRRIYVKDDILTRETPLGKEYYIIIKH